MKEKESFFNSAVDRALLVLECISQQRSGITLANLSKELDIPKSTLHRILETLKQRDFVEIIPDTEKYLIGLKAIEIGFSGVNNVEIVDISSPYLKNIAKTTGETSFLGVQNEGKVVYLYKAEGIHAIRTTAVLGSRCDLHATGLGKAMLTGLSLPEIDQIISVQGMKKYTPNTITQLHDLYEELSRIRLNGFAADREEHVPGLTCYAVPLLNYAGEVIAAMSLAGPTYRVTPKETQIAQHLKTAASHISRRLGYVGMME